MTERRPKSTAQWTGYDTIILALDETACLIPMYGPAAILSHEDANLLIDALNLFKSKYTAEQIAKINKDEYDFYHGEGEYSEKRQSHTVAKPQDGFVYLLKAQDGYYKIGKTLNLEGRLSQYKNLPWTVHLIDFLHVKDMNKAEASIHKMFADVRLKGEWFNLTSEHIKMFRSYNANC